MARPKTSTRSTMRVIREAPQILRDLRSLSGLDLSIERIGCQVQAFWPPLPDLPEGTDVVFLALSPDMLGADFAWCQREDTPPLSP